MLTDLKEIAEDNIYVKVVIYDLQGKVVKNLCAKRIASSQNYKLTWDGKDEDGNYVGSGVYLLKVQLDSVVKTKKIFFVQ